MIAITTASALIALAGIAGCIAFRLAVPLAHLTACARAAGLFWLAAAAAHGMGWI
jgi:hypothetical protein